MAMTRPEAIGLIRSNIRRYGHHIYLVTSGIVPKFSYTIGALKKLGAELIFPGGFFYSAKESQDIINRLVENVSSTDLLSAPTLSVGSLGAFQLGPVHESWAKEMILGAYDYHETNMIPAFQIKPDREHWTVDVPDLAQPWSPTTEPVWRWLREPWTFSLPPETVAVTNMAALRGERVTEVARWEEDHWELFAGAGPDVDKRDMRVVPLATLLAADPSLGPVMSLPIGKGLWRNPDDIGWHRWNWESDEDIP